MDSSEAPKLRFQRPVSRARTLCPAAAPTSGRCPPAADAPVRDPGKPARGFPARWRSHTRRGPTGVFWGSHYCYCGKRKGAKRRTFMKRIVLLLVSLFVVFLSTGCGPSDAEKRAQQVAQAKDDALKLRQQLAQAKSGADAENVRQQIMKVLSDASLTVESIHFTEAELKDYVKAASAAEKPAPPPPKKAKA